MKRALLAAVAAALLATIVPGAVSAERRTKFEEHHVGAYCEFPTEGGFVIAFLDQSSEFGSFAGLDAWLDPAIPFEDPLTLSGTTEAVHVTESPDEIVLSATFPVFGPGGNELGDATLVATMAPDGEPEIIEGDDFGNRNSHTRGTRQALAGTVLVSLPGGVVLEGPCFGDVTDIRVHESNPHAFTFHNQGVELNCSWETDDGFAFLFAVNDDSGLNADAGLFTAGVEIARGDTGLVTGTFDAMAISIDIPLRDFATDELQSAAVEATFTPVGDPVTSTLRSQDGHGKITQQSLAPEGTIAFSTGDVFVLDDEACDANAFKSHSSTNRASGPKPGRAPANDTPDGAIALEPGDRLNTTNRGAALDAEVQVSTCPEGEFDQFGHTLWYSIEGTGGPITVDTAGSGIDTVIAAFVDDGGTLVEIACNDDVLLEPIGITYQGAITFDTEIGVTYLVEVGGYMHPFFSDEAEYGRIRLRVS